MSMSIVEEFTSSNGSSQVVDNALGCDSGLIKDFVAQVLVVAKGLNIIKIIGRANEGTDNGLVFHKNIGEGRLRVTEFLHPSFTLC